MRRCTMPVEVDDKGPEPCNRTMVRHPSQPEAACWCPVHDRLACPRCGHRLLCGTSMRCLECGECLKLDVVAKAWPT